MKDTQTKKENGYTAKSYSEVFKIVNSKRECNDIKIKR